MSVLAHLQVALGCQLPVQIEGTPKDNPANLLIKIRQICVKVATISVQAEFIS